MSSGLEKGRTLEELRRCQESFEASLPIGSLSRLSALHHGSDDAAVTVTAALGRGAVGELPHETGFSGNAQVTLRLTCQRCLELMDYEVSAPIAVVFVKRAGTESESSSYDIWELDGSTLSLSKVVEEYILLALPLATLHDEQGCPVPTTRTAVPPADKQRPFAGLASALGRSAETNE